MDDSDYIEGIADYFIKNRSKEIENLKPEETILISINENRIFSELLEEKKGKFRKILRDSIVRAYIDYNLKEADVVKVNEIVNKYRKIGLNIDIPQSVEMNEINAEEHERQIITFSCEIHAITEPKTLPISEVFVCKNCGEDISYEYDSGEHTCPMCEGEMENDGIAESETVVTVLLQELITNKKRKTSPVKFMADIHREQAREIDYNQKVMITGIFKSLTPNTPRNKSKERSEVLIDVITLKSIEVDKSRKMDEQTLKNFEYLARDGKLIDALIESYAPHIYGNKEAKLACILALVGGVEQQDYKDKIHVLLIGDPATAKTELGEYIVRISPNSTVTDGTGSTGVGLGASAIKLPDGTQGISLGPLVKYKFVFLDELDKMKESDYNMLLKLMNDGECMRSIGGADIRYYNSVSIVASANPTAGKWDLKNPHIPDNVNLKPYLLSRFDLMIRFLNIPNKEEDRAIINHIMMWRHGKIKPRFSEEELTCYLNTVRDLTPLIPLETETFLRDFYVKREDYQKDENSVSIDQRQYGALVRIAYAIAKILLKKEVDEECVSITLDLYKKCIESLGMSFEDGGSFSEASSNLMKYAETKEQSFRRVFREVESEEGEAYRNSLIKKMLKEKHWTNEDKSNGYINTLHRQGIIIEKSNGSFRLVG